MDVVNPHYTGRTGLTGVSEVLGDLKSFDKLQAEQTCKWYITGCFSAVAPLTFEMKMDGKCKLFLMRVQMTFSPDCPILKKYFSVSVYSVIKLSVH